MVGSDGSDVMWPKNGAPAYYHMNLQNGQQWFTSKYYSSKTVKAAFGRRARIGHARGTKNMRDIAIVGKG